MNFSEILIKQYAKKVYGFAYDKTRNVHDAEDLSQSILMALCDDRIPNKAIQNMDAYVYRVCQYSWSNYLRKNKPLWTALGNQHHLDNLADDDFEEPVINQELYGKLRQEIMYLSKQKRDVTVMFYYENKRGAEISKILNLPAVTVRWHLSQAKMDLKERIEMVETTNSIYDPVKLCAGREGWNRNTTDPCGLDSDVLMQNICWICQGKALTLEEMARTLGVAAFYIEDKLERLLFMDYFKKVGKNKYQTNFFIFDDDYLLTHYHSLLDNTPPLAEALRNITEKALPQIKALGLQEYDDGYLKWAILALAISQTLHGMDHFINERKNLSHGAPMRKDGSKRWAIASVPIQAVIAKHPDLPEEFKEYCLLKPKGICYPKNENISAVSYDLGFSPAVSQPTAMDLSKLKRIHYLIRNKENPNEYDKEIIAEMIEKGCVSNQDHMLKLNAPYLTKEQKASVDLILQRCYAEYFDKEKLTVCYENYIETMRTKIPAFIDENERRHHLTSFSPFVSIFYVLRKTGFLQEPPENEKRSLCTIIWEE